jgi:hypothetical protein
LFNVQREIRQTDHHIPSFVEQCFPRGFHDVGIGGRRLHQSALDYLDAPAGSR